MKNSIASVILVLAFSMMFTASAFGTCTKIQSGLLTDSNGNVITTGYDQWGYNYQAHMFNGFYENFTRPAVPVTTGSVRLMMKWSDDWLSNTDCTGDNKLDRGGPSGPGTSKGWLTNHEEGDYLGGDGEVHQYTYFVKIVYDGGTACAAQDPNCIWGVYTIIEEVYNDPYGGHNGVDRNRLVNPAGLGFYQ